MRVCLPSLLPLLLLPALTLACSGCGSGGSPAEVPPAETDPGHRVIAVRPVGSSPELASRLNEMAGDMGRWAEGWRLQVLEEGEGLPPGTVVEILAGALPWDGPPPPLDGLPVSLGDGTLRLAGDAYPDPSVSLAVRLPDTSPERWVIAGRRPRAVARLVAERAFRATGYLFGGWEGEVDYMLRQADWKRRAGTWESVDGEFRAADRRDDFATAHRWLAGLRPVEAGAATLLVPPDERAAPPEPERAAQELAAAVESMAQLLGAEPVPRRPLTVAAETDYTQIIRHTGRVGEAVADGLADVHLVHHPRDGFAVRHALARVLLAQAGLAEELPPYLEAGAALWLSGDWYGRRWDAWLAPVAAAGVLPTVQELLADEELPDGSELLWAPVAARVLDAAPGATLADKLSPPPGVGHVERVLAELRALPAPEPLRRPVELPPFHAGVSLAMLNHLELGYHAPSVVGALAHLRDGLGANAVSLMPFIFQRDAARPGMVYLNASPRSETDVAMIHAGRRAEEAGMAVLWKPQIWLSRSWPGEVAMTNADDWRAWWRSYRRYVVHQALLAEWVEAEAFSLGVELGRTVHQEDEWRGLAAAVRLFFGGPLTYSANWYGDFEEVTWWDAVDLLGVDAYQPLSGDPAAGREELVAGARAMLERLGAVAEREGRPLLMTEVGYAAHEAAWMAPHEEGGTYSPQDQALAYEALFAALEPGPPPWLQGMYLWKAFSNASPDGAGGRRRDGGADERADFRFLGRPAEEVIRTFYADLD